MTSETSTHSHDEFAAALGLKWGGEGLFVGRIRGFPVGLKFIDPLGEVLLFQVRHWLTESAAQAKGVSYDSSTATLIAERKIEIDFDDRMAWVSLMELGDQPEAALRILNGVLDAFEKAALIGNPDLCHYCQKDVTANLEIADGKVAQICPVCLAERVKQHRSVTAGSTTAEAVPIVLMSPVAAVVGAILWAACFAIYNWFFEDAGEIRVPTLFMALVTMGIGFAVGGPVGWIIKQNRRRGRAVSAAAAILFGLLAVIAGELLYVAWLIYRNFHLVSFRAAAQVMPRLYLHNDFSFLFFKGIAALASVGMAYEISKPRKATLKL